MGGVAQPAGVCNNYVLEHFYWSQENDEYSWQLHFEWQQEGEMERFSMLEWS